MARTIFAAVVAPSKIRWAAVDSGALFQQGICHDLVDLRRIELQGHVERVWISDCYDTFRVRETCRRWGWVAVGNSKFWHQVIQAKIIHYCGNPPPAPRIVVLCGSGRFREAFERAEFEETLAGRIVLTIGCNTHDVARSEELKHHKEALDELHFRKIDLADEVLVINVGGYVGESTAREIAYARDHEKPIRFLEAKQSGYDRHLETTAAASEAIESLAETVAGLGYIELAGEYFGILLKLRERLELLRRNPPVIQTATPANGEKQP